MYVAPYKAKKVKWHLGNNVHNKVYTLDIKRLSAFRLRGRVQERWLKPEWMPWLLGTSL